MNRTVFEIQRKSLTQIASKAIHAHILSGQKFIEMPKIVNLASFLVDFQTALIVDYCALKIKV